MVTRQSKCCIFCYITDNSQGPKLTNEIYTHDFLRWYTYNTTSKNIPNCKFEDFSGKRSNNALLAANVATRQLRLSQMIFPEGSSVLLVESVNSNRQRKQAMPQPDTESPISLSLTASTICRSVARSLGPHCAHSQTQIHWQAGRITTGDANIA